MGTVPNFYDRMMPLQAMKENLLSVSDAARILEIPPAKVHQWVKRGSLPAVRMGGEIYFRPEAVRALFEEQNTVPPRKKHRILIVDDDLLVGESLKNLLLKAGYDAAVVSIGLAALDLVVREDFDLIIADIRMPGMNGLETLKAIRELRRQFKRPPFPEVILTAYDDESVRQEAHRMGIPDFILKPFQLDEFLSILKKTLTQQKRRKRPENVIQG